MCRKSHDTLVDYFLQYFSEWKRDRDLSSFTLKIHVLFLGTFWKIHFCDLLENNFKFDFLQPCNDFIIFTIMLYDGLREKLILHNRFTSDAYKTISKKSDEYYEVIKSILAIHF